MQPIGLVLLARRLRGSLHRPISSSSIADDDGTNPVAAQLVPADSSNYDFGIGEWHQVVDGQIAPEPRFIGEESIYPSALEER